MPARPPKKSSSSGRCWIPAKGARAARTDTLTVAVAGESAAHQVVEVIHESTENPGLNLFAGICKNPPRCVLRNSEIARRNERLVEADPTKPRIGETKIQLLSIL